MGLRGSEYDWNYKAKFVGRPVWERIDKQCTRGRILGGSSSANYFSWIPGCKPTYDRWGEYGGQEWTWEPLRPYLRKSATYHGDPKDAKRYSAELEKIGAGGPLRFPTPTSLSWRTSVRLSLRLGRPGACPLPRTSTTVR